MQDNKKVAIIDAVKNMSDHEVNILAAFIAGFRAGKKQATTTAPR